MDKLPYSIKDKYSAELEKIDRILSQLKDGRVKDKTGLDMDGYLYKHANDLQEYLNDLLDKIQNGKDSIIH